MYRSARGREVPSKGGQDKLGVADEMKERVLKVRQKRTWVECIKVEDGDLVAGTVNDVVIYGKGNWAGLERIRLLGMQTWWDKG